MFGFFSLSLNVAHGKQLHLVTLFRIIVWTCSARKEASGMEVLFVSGVTPITTNPTASALLYRDALGLPLEGEDGGYLSTASLGGVKHFGVWPLEAAAQSCFGDATWPADIPVPQATIEFELKTIEAVHAAVEELTVNGYTFVHGAKTEEWGQTVARLLSPEGLLLGLSYTPWMH